MKPKVVSSLGVIIATVGRKEIVEQTILSLASRKSVPAWLMVVGVKADDLPDLSGELPFQVGLFLSSTKGSTFQRNHGVRQLPAAIELVTFLDDDMEVHDDYCAEIEKVFCSAPEVAGFSGYIMANGGIDRVAARVVLDQYEIHPEMPGFEFYHKRWPGLYGCAMNIRRCWLAVESFDERLPLYAVGEDCEMGFRLNKHGSVGGSARCAVAHLAARSGRISEVGVGYAQIINYLYFARKGIGFPRLATYWQYLVRLPLVNLFFRFFPAWDRRNSIDRKGRFRGNLLALWDVIRGRIDPMNLVSVTAKYGK